MTSKYMAMYDDAPTSEMPIDLVKEFLERAEVLHEIMDAAVNRGVFLLETQPNGTYVGLESTMLPIIEQILRDLSKESHAEDPFGTAVIFCSTLIMRAVFDRVAGDG